MDVEEVNVLDRSSSWMDCLTLYLKEGKLPDDPTEAQRIKKNSLAFEIINGELFKKAFKKPYLKCITPERGGEVLDELHQGHCSPHIGGQSLAERAMRQGYFWPTMQNDAQEMVKRCDKCQRFAKLIHQPAQNLTAISSPLPFAKWGVDIL